MLRLLRLPDFIGDALAMTSSLLLQVVFGLCRQLREQGAEFEGRDIDAGDFERIGTCVAALMLYAFGDDEYRISLQLEFLSTNSAFAAAGEEHDFIAIGVGVGTGAGAGRDVGEKDGGLVIAGGLRAGDEFEEAFAGRVGFGAGELPAIEKELGHMASFALDREILISKL